MNYFSSIAAALSRSLGSVDAQPARSVHGGCINKSYRWESARGSLFVKVTSSSRLAMFEAEVEGLEELRRVEALHVPEVQAVGAAGDSAYLALEWIDFGADGPVTHAKLGEQLALQHRVRTGMFGWHRDNTIGSTPQSNTRMLDGIEFLRERRLRPQLDLARHNGHEGRLQERGARLLDALHELFAGYRPEPSLLHGDLWGGNWGADKQGQPVAFDPAVYYGDRESDIAMTRLFGGFEREFYAAYEAAWPMDSGARVREALYNLYHILNHLNLFGAGYLEQAQSMIDGLLRQTGRY